MTLPTSLTSSEISALEDSISLRAFGKTNAQAGSPVTVQQASRRRLLTTAYTVSVSSSSVQTTYVQSSLTSSTIGALVQAATNGGIQSGSVVVTSTGSGSGSSSSNNKNHLVLELGLGLGLGIGLLSLIGIGTIVGMKMNKKAKKTDEFVAPKV